MSSYFLMAGLSGVYGTHGETFQNTADDSTEVRWWAKGGNLVGESPTRISFFKSIMDQAPVTELTPEISSKGDVKKLNTNQYILSKPGEYYLAYVADSNQVLEVKLTGGAPYKMDVIDSWNMQIVEKGLVEPGIFRHKTVGPYTVLRFSQTKTKAREGAL